MRGVALMAELRQACEEAKELATNLRAGARDASSVAERIDTVMASLAAHEAGFDVPEEVVASGEVAAVSGEAAEVGGEAAEVGGEEAAGGVAAESPEFELESVRSDDWDDVMMDRDDKAFPGTILEGDELEEAEELLDMEDDEGNPEAASSVAALGPRPPSTLPWQNFRKPISADVW